MVDGLAPLPPVNARIHKTQVTEKDPHHQQEQKKQKEKKQEIEDEILLNEEFKKDESDENVEIPTTPPKKISSHKIDIEV